jgi:ketosteroid isomerase-like protein
MTDHEQHLRGLYAAISANASGDELAAFFHPNAEQVEYPSLMRPEGHRRPLAEMTAGAELGRQIIESQAYDVHTVIENGDQVAVQLTWTAKTAKDVGGLAAGSQLVAHVAAFYIFRDGLVLRQSSYDCYEPLPH